MFSGGYHIILVPKNAEKTKRFTISSFTARLFLLLALVVVPVVFGSFFLAVYFQNELVSVKNKSNENTQILKEKEILTARVAGLERSLSHAEDSLNSLQHTMDVEVGEMKAGLGPVPDDIILPDGEQHNVAPLAKSSIDEFLEDGEGVSLSSLKGSMNDIDGRISGLNDKIKEILNLNADKIRFMQANPSQMPLQGWITSDFGVRHSPWGGGYKMHYGLDVASPIGTPIHAPADGKVVFADFRGGFGHLVVLDHGYGLTTLYGHTSKVFVKKGDIVKRGDTIAAVGSTGSSTGPHLHYEVHVDGIPTDPLTFVMQ